jgi:hypothetical protein
MGFTQYIHDQIGTPWRNGHYAHNLFSLAYVPYHQLILSLYCASLCVKSVLTCIYPTKYGRQPR